MKVMFSKAVYAEMEKAFGKKDLSKLRKEIITDKNGHRKTVYKKIDKPEEGKNKGAAAPKEEEKAAAEKTPATPAAKGKSASTSTKTTPTKTAAPKRSGSSGGGYINSSPFTSSERPSNDILFQENGQPKKVTLSEGERLTLLALSTFGDKAFWAYIYDVNAFQLGDPNTVPKGLPLYLPDPSYFGIDASNPASVKKAQNRAMQILNDPQSDGPWGRR